MTKVISSTRNLHVSLTRIGAFIIAGILSASASADDSCMQNQATLNDCAEKSAAENQAKLDVAYRAALDALRSSSRSLSSEMVPALTSAQDAWVKSRDATCQFDAMLLSGGGSMGRLVYSNCISSLTVRQTVAFEKLVDCLRTPECKFPVALHQFQMRENATSLNWE